MAIVKMHKVSIIGMENNKDRIIENLMNIGVIDISDLSNKDSYKEVLEITKRENVEDKVSELESKIKAVKNAIDYLAFYDKKKKGLFAKKRDIEPDLAKRIIEGKENLICIVEEINKIDEKLSGLKTEKNRLENFIITLKPWEKLQIPVDITSTNTTNIIFGVIPAAEDADMLIEDVKKRVEECVIEIINVDKYQAYIQVIFHKSKEEEIMDVLKQKNFNVVMFDIKGTVKDNIRICEMKIKELDNEQNELRKKLIKYANIKNELEVLYDYLNIERDKIEVLKNLLKTENVFILEGWIPQHSLNNFKDEINKDEYGEYKECLIEITESQKGEEYPILLKNNKFVQPFELVTELYSLPKPGGIDPNPYMAPFFAIFFGLMLSDAGYGILLAIITAFILFKFRPGQTVSKLLGLLFWGGIFTIVWGALFGGWFGDLAEKITAGRFVIKPLWFNPLNDPMKLLICSFILGGIHLLVGMGLNGYKTAREGKVWDAIIDVGSWYIFLIGLALLLVGGSFSKVGMYMTTIGAILLIVTQGRHEKNIFKKFLKGVGSLYNTVGFMSDVLSYSRLLALGLATGVIASVINTVATLFGFNIFGILIFIVVFLVGHLFNILINCLGAYVHSSRLQYVEFFGKFYEGGGIPYKPFKINTKYVNIVDGRKM